jgi:DnaJ family protein A protein 2
MFAHKVFGRQALGALLPPKKTDAEPRPEIVDEADFEESDIVDVRSRSFTASSSFFDHGFPSQFGGDTEEDWVDDDDDDNDMSDDRMGPEPQCPQQ